eukprot:364429-Chlamydomonas_euryale.AAC.29
MCMLARHVTRVSSRSPTGTVWGIPAWSVGSCSVLLAGNSRAVRDTQEGSTLSPGMRSRVIAVWLPCCASLIIGGTTMVQNIEALVVDMLPSFLFPFRFLFLNALCLPLRQPKNWRPKGRPSSIRRSRCLQVRRRVRAAERRRRHASVRRRRWHGALSVSARMRASARMRVSGRAARRDGSVGEWEEGRARPDDRMSGASNEVPRASRTTEVLMDCRGPSGRRK